MCQKGELSVARHEWPVQNEYVSSGVAAAQEMWGWPQLPLAIKGSSWDNPFKGLKKDLEHVQNLKESKPNNIITIYYYNKDEIHVIFYWKSNGY